MKIRPYQKGDEADIWELHNQVLQEIGAHPGNGSWDEDLKNIEASYIEPGGIFLVIESSGEIVGFGGIVPLSEKTCEIRKMRVLKEKQGKGLGKKLLQMLEEHAWEKGFMEIVLQTTSGQAAANNLYERSRYQMTSQEEAGGFIINNYCKWSA